VSGYPSIEKACLEIAYDNGGVNRLRPEAQVRKEIADFLAARPYSDHFGAIDKWLGELSKDELETVCAGEETEMLAVLSTAPAWTSSLLEQYFEEVC
jgi:hypothetical protein